MKPAPADHVLSKPLFAAGTFAPTEARRLVSLARASLDGDGDAEEHTLRAWDALQETPRRAFAEVQSGALPLAALSVLAGLTAIVRPKDYAMLPFWNIALEIGAPGEEDPGQSTLLSEEELEMVAELEAEGNLAAAGELRKTFEEEAREDIARETEREKVREARIAETVAGLTPEDAARVRAIYDETRKASDSLRGPRRRSPGPPKAPPPPEHVTWANRVAPIGARGSTLHEVAELRPMLWINRDCGVAWEALCMAIDAIGAASFAGLERLGSLASENPKLPFVVWLDEIACRVARENTRGERRARELDALMSGTDFGKHAQSLAAGPELGRELFEEQGTRIHDAWLKLAAAPRLELPRIERLGEEMPAPERAAVRKAAKRGDATAKMILHLEEGSDRMAEAERAEEERAGPFYESRSVPEDVSDVIDSVVHCAMLGFRELYGLELLREALPELEQAVGQADRR